MKRVIVALDRMDIVEAVTLTEKIVDEVAGVKINDLLIHKGIRALGDLKRSGILIMADPKLYDTPETIINSLDLILDEADIVTVHVSAHFNPYEYNRPDLCDYIAGVTVLTSFDSNTCKKIYQDEIVENVVFNLMQSAKEFKYKYLICSGHELNMVKKYGFPLKPIVPGIRPSWYKKEDSQKRIMTPKEAIEKGAEYLVIGRPLGIRTHCNHDEVLDNIKRINDEIGG